MKITDLSDDELLRRTERLTAAGRVAEADLLEHLGEIDRRNLHPGRTFRSLFEYCVHRLKMSEGSAYRRIRAARTCRAHPDALDMLRAGKIHLEALALLHAAARAPDFDALLGRAAGASTRRVEAMLAERETETPQRDVIRFVGSTPPSPAPAEPADPLFAPPSSEIGPLSTETAPGATPPLAVTSPPAPPRRRVRLAFTADHRFYVTLEKARALLRHKYPDGRLEGVLMDALKVLLEKKDPVLRWAASKRRGTAAS